MLGNKPTTPKNTLRPVNYSKVPCDSAYATLGEDYRPDAPPEGLLDTPYKDNLAFSLTVEDAMAQGLCSDPRVTVLIPTLFRHESHRSRRMHLTVESLERDGRYIRGAVTVHADINLMHAIPPTVRMNSKARLHIIVN